MRRSNVAGWAVAMAAGISSLVAVGTGCGKLDPAECQKLKEQAFDTINSASVCSSDADCKGSEWPGCTRPVSTANFDKVHAMMQTFQKGKCEEKKVECKPPQPIFCQEGLCAFKYKNAAPPPGTGDGMIVQ
jgi:hypothetical protein